MATFAMGDIHGHSERAEAVLRAAGVIDASGSWAAGDSTLWFVGDFFDRGPDGAGAVRLAMRLQQEAAAQGGRVEALLGNHELMVLGVLRFGEENSDLVNLWFTNGGRLQDLRALGDDEKEWLGNLPAVGAHDGTLILHCDSDFYATKGTSPEEVNASVTEVVKRADLDDYFELMQQFFSRLELDDEARLDALLASLGAERVVHGHTPIPIASDVDPRSVEDALVYAGGRAINVDGGMYLGGPGFLHRFDD